MIFAKASKQILLMTLCSLIAVMFLGLLPWSAETAKEMDEHGDTKDVTRYVSYNMYQNIDFFDEMEDVADTLIAIAALQWITLIFVLLALLGLVMVRMDIMAKIGQVLIFVGSLAFIFAIIILALHAYAIYQMGQAQDEMRKVMKDWVLMYSYNYVPLIMDIFIVLFGVLLFIGSSLPLLRVIFEPYGPPAYPAPGVTAYPLPQYPAPQYPQPQAPAPSPPPPQPQYPPPSPPPPQQAYAPPPPQAYEPASAPPAMATAQAVPVAQAAPAPATAEARPAAELRSDGSVVAEPKETPKEAETQLCLHCLNIVPTGTRFCTKCGKKIV